MSTQDMLVPATIVRGNTATFDVYAEQTLLVAVSKMLFTVEFNIPHNPSNEPDSYEEDIVDEETAKQAPKWKILRAVAESFYPKSYKVFLNGNLLFTDSYDETKECNENFYDHLDTWEGPVTDHPNQRQISVTPIRIGELMNDLNLIPMSTDRFSFEVEIGFRPEKVFLPDITFKIKSAQFRAVYEEDRGCSPYKLTYMTRNRYQMITDKEGMFYGKFKAEKLDHFLVRVENSTQVLYDVQYAIIYNTSYIASAKSVMFPFGDSKSISISGKAPTTDGKPVKVILYIYELKAELLHFIGERKQWN